MLTLSRRPYERVRLMVGGVTIWVQVVGVDRNQIKLAFDAPREVEIMREELLTPETPEDRQ